MRYNKVTRNEKSELGENSRSAAPRMDWIDKGVGSDSNNDTKVRHQEQSQVRIYANAGKQVHMKQVHAMPRGR